MVYKEKGTCAGSSWIRLGSLIEGLATVTLI